MASKSINILILLCIIVSFTTAVIQTVNGRIKMTVGTSAGSSEVVTFIANLIPVYEDYKRYLDVLFVPWGMTKIENGNLVCEYGPRECWANRLHRCVLNLLTGNQDAQVNYMACEFTTPFPAFNNGTYACARNAGLNLINVDHCMSTTGGALERPAQDASTGPIQEIQFVPFVVFNDNTNRDISTQARQRLRGLICFALADDPATNVTHCQV